MRAVRSENRGARVDRVDRVEVVRVPSQASRTALHPRDHHQVRARPKAQVGWFDGHLAEALSPPSRLPPHRRIRPWVPDPPGELATSRPRK
jgi:hypothetical protein